MVAHAYWDLATCRPQPGFRVPWTAINAYVEAKGIHERERFEHLIRAMDDEHLEAMERRMKKQRKTKA